MFRRELPYTLIQDTDHKEILAKLKQAGVQRAHFTNGTYAWPQSITVATTLAGFKHAVDSVDASLPLIIAINSDQSMHELGKKDFDDQDKRAASVAEPLAQAFPDNRVFVIFYDDKTPNALYAFLAAHNITATLHKWGFGTNPAAPKIEGAENFAEVFGYPLVDDKKPLCWEDTPTAEQPNVHVADLRNKLITPARLCMFALPESLASYQAEGVVAAKQLNI